MGGVNVCGPKSLMEDDDDSEVFAEMVTILSGTVRISGWLLLELLSFPGKNNDQQLNVKKLLTRKFVSFYTFIICDLNTQTPPQ